ncbi:methylated-DNA--[protein]-cysteine S-methyltransferase [Psychrobacter sp. FDAARGOS_221]|nr:methylated-DNA--[protein]-cysteine S-methyltransferase [Psychrobacter sp. FDAARGOS_221]PNK61781.1 methylated-DNA--[protein]-cysteine S-methyltransferase [Psychrobacter sp. FDAARGOS_221]
MIVTTTDIAQFRLLLIADNDRLVTVDWLAEQQAWYDSKSIVMLKKQYQLSDDEFRFIDKNSLSKENKTELLLLEVIEQLGQYANGERKEFDIKLDWRLGTTFQQKVWRALQQIEYGQTISYAQLAKNIGQPTAYRAVANANGKNPFSIIIPCHRVIATGGGLGGYTGGIDKKQYLLQLEQSKAQIYSK